MPTPLDCSPANLRKIRSEARAATGYSVAVQEATNHVLRSCLVIIVLQSTRYARRCPVHAATPANNAGR